MQAWCVLACVLAAGLGARACPLAPAGAGPKAPGDNFYRLLVNGDVERYQPGQRYVVTLVGSRTHDVVQQFSRFAISLEPLDPAATRAPSRQGQFQLFADTLTRFDDECVNAVREADDLPKTEVQVMWKAPPAGSGCVLLKAMVYENASRWFAEDGQLTQRVCEDTRADDDCCACDDAKYQMVFQGLWSPETHPKDFPKEAMWLTHFSDVIGATHAKNFSFWGEGQIATDGFRSLAEWGSVDLLERELRQRGGALRALVRAPGLWHPRVTASTAAAFSVDRRRHLLSLASMFGPSPDWVVGVSGLDLCRKDCTWEESKVVDLYPYDAGTDNGISYMSPNSETNPRERMYRITTMYPEDPRAPFYAPGGRLLPLARLTLTRTAVRQRACDERQLQAMLQLEEVENEQAVGRPECTVSAWGAWSACSVACGKGLRMRTRQYRAPAAAAAAGCDRQLVSKEMCVAAVAECPEQSEAEEEPSEGVAEGMCATSEWGPWSECSATCGVGVSSRRRHFTHPMGHKKCPLVNTEENRKCMEPACPEGAGAADAEAVSDPQCPTTDWSSWSPCSTSCGRGLRFRTRLLLVAPAAAPACQRRSELLQHRACSDAPVCSTDPMAAKRTCMEAADEGPCRGLYRRWAFAAAKGMCVPFSYGGCRGNRNNFLTQEDCLATCGALFGALSGGAPAPALPSNGLDDAARNATGSADCQLSAWGEWSRCSVSCGAGYQERSRSVLAQPGPGGAPCPSRLVRRRRCSRLC